MNPRYESLYSQNQQLRQKLSLRKQQEDELRKERELRECTFHPKIGSTKDKREGDVFERGRKWREEKEARLRKEREEKRGKEIEGVTFKPAIERKRVRQLEKEMKGVEEFVQRLRKGKVEEDRRKSIVEYRRESVTPSRRKGREEE